LILEDAMEALSGKPQLGVMHSVWFGKPATSNQATVKTRRLVSGLPVPHPRPAPLLASIHCPDGGVVSLGKCASVAYLTIP
jgi:hypothetical protein